MPHCIVEHSGIHEIDTVMGVVNKCALNSKLFSKNGEDIKVRAVQFDKYLMADGSANFIHIVLKILAGRSSDQISQLLNNTMEALDDLQLSSITITIEVLVIDKARYLKRIIT
ncbi:5-carboxymethyl-2-hydroxymuconate Delta-isomerase [Marinicellulosiphila megalodicopiae]|uniref:5-carboxymethyl-2-hydroxymuconate Delta-isomerase n=1 Tax=Marinicellulosiphila megalodicopiae TaxID=2724896 RepID=UPI003BAFF01F